MKAWLAVIVVVSVLLRGALVVQGGQFFFPDESRYLDSRLAAQALVDGRWSGALAALTSGVEHAGFKLLGVVPALIEQGAGENAHIPAAFFSAFSVMAIVLMWLLARRLGADEREALWAALLLATSNSCFYYASHLLPYDVGLVLGLLSLYVGASDSAAPRVSITTGVFAVATFVTYNGYWTLAGVALVAHVVRGPRTGARIWRRAAYTGVGALVPLVALYVCGELVAGRHVVAAYLAFARSVTQGAFSEGGVFPVLYFWAAEGYLSLIWLGLTGVAIVAGLRRQPHRLVLGVGGFVGVYACLAVTSVVLQEFVVYGRLVRQMVPFVALVGAFGLRTIDGQARGGRFASRTVVAAILVVAAMNVREPLRLSYPREFAAAARERFPDFELTGDMIAAEANDVSHVGAYDAYFIKYLFPFPQDVGPVQGDVLMSAAHPQSYRPFLFEGFDSLQRRRFEAASFDMCVVKRERE